MLVGRNKEVIKEDQYSRRWISAWCWPSILGKTTRTSLLVDAILSLQTAQRDLDRKRFFFQLECWNHSIPRAPSQYALCLKN